MSELATASHAELFSLFGTMQRELGACSCVEVAAQRCLDTIYEHFAQDLVLARLYVTSPYEILPAEIKKFVDNLARTKNLPLSDNLTVLSLIGTRGRQLPWNDRRRSAGHAGIPLASADFISALPMIARLLTDLGVEIKWSERPERGFSTIHPGYSGLFYVPDARTSQDQYQRHIIPAQDFVAKEDVRTVFGVGGSYTTGTLFAMIFFSQKTMSREAALRYLPLVTMFKALTSAHVEAGRIFAS